MSQKTYLASIALALILTLLSTSGLAVETGVFQPPSLEGYKFEKSWTVDVDQAQDGIRETTIEKFVLDKRRVVLKWTCNGKTWGWSILGNYPDKSDTINNYFVRDAEGKDVFTEKIPANEQFYLPAWVKPD